MASEQLPTLRVVGDVEIAAEAMWRWTYEQRMGLARDGAWPVPAADYWRQLAGVALEAVKP